MTAPLNPLSVLGSNKISRYEFSHAEIIVKMDVPRQLIESVVLFHGPRTALNTDKVPTNNNYKEVD